MDLYATDLTRTFQHMHVLAALDRALLWRVLRNHRRRGRHVATALVALVTPSGSTYGTAPSRRRQVGYKNAVATVFLLSPARCGGERALQLVSSPRSELAKRLHAGTATLGETMAWLSALYFRGKLAYSARFGATHPLPSALVMAPGQGLRPPEWGVTASDLHAMGKIDIETRAFVQPLRRDAEQVALVYGADVNVVLLGSIATGKYVDTLLDVFGERLLFPESFVGRGDMSRGGLMLRAARSGEELSYTPVAGAKRHGARPPKLPKPGRKRAAPGISSR
jgi:hypothetical protein